MRTSSLGISPWVGLCRNESRKGGHPSIISISHPEVFPVRRVDCIMELREPPDVQEGRELRVGVEVHYRIGPPHHRFRRLRTQDQAAGCFSLISMTTSSTAVLPHSVSMRLTEARTRGERMRGSK